MTITETIQEFYNDKQEELVGKTPAQAGMMFERYCVEELGLNEPVCGFVEFKTCLEAVQREACPA